VTRLPHWSSLAAMVIMLSGIGVATVIELTKTVELNEFGVVPDFSLVERSGRRVTLGDLDGQIWIADFIFTSCAGTCPMMTDKMRLLEKELPEEIRMVSFTVDPTRDTPEVLTRYADQRGVTGDRWMFLTGERDELYKLSKEGFHLAVDDTIGTEIEPITHSTRFTLVDGRGNIRGYYDGTAMETVAQLAQDVENLLSERD
jgi:cytochrome oxidase Cu insertion factor (SCO1/SenC/PrrC family)